MGPQYDKRQQHQNTKVTPLNWISRFSHEARLLPDNDGLLDGELANVPPQMAHFDIRAKLGNLALFAVDVCRSGVQPIAGAVDR